MILHEVDLKVFIPELEGPWAQLFVDAANAGVHRRLGETLDASREAEAKLIMVRAIRRAMNTKEWARAETAGPFSVSYAVSGLGLFDEAATAELDNLIPSVGGALPRGSFPMADDYSRLFAHPRRRYGR